jgi:hypothetical protein
MNRIVILLFLISITANTSLAEWKRLAGKTKMDDKPFINWYIMTADNSVRLDIFCYEQGDRRWAAKSVLVDINFPHTVVEAPYHDQLTVRFDNDEPGPLPFERNSDYKSFSSGNPRELITDYLLGSKTFQVEYTAYPGTPRVAKFNVAGLESLAKGHCGL